MRNCVAGQLNVDAKPPAKVSVVIGARAPAPKMRPRVAKAGSLTLPAKKLYEIVKALPETDVRIQEDKNGVKVAADIHCLDRNFACPLALGSSYQAMVDRFGKVVHVVRVHAKLAGEILSVQHRVVIARHGVHPGEIGKCEGGLQIDRWRSGRSRRLSAATSGR